MAYMLEVNGLVFTEVDLNGIRIYNVQDLNYGLTLGSFELEDGPGWVFKNDKYMRFLDFGQLQTLSGFAKMLITEVGETKASPRE